MGKRGRACLADFGLVTIVSDPASTTMTTSAKGGTTRWMSPELLDPSQLGLKDSQPTRESDRYALGMVIYEVLSGQVPFAPCNVGFIISKKIVEGERPERPSGLRGTWFTKDLWALLERCWSAQPQTAPPRSLYLDIWSRLQGLGSHCRLMQGMLSKRMAICQLPLRTITVCFITSSTPNPRIQMPP